MNINLKSQKELHFAGVILTHLLKIKGRVGCDEDPLDTGICSELDYSMDCSKVSESGEIYDFFEAITQASDWFGWSRYSGDPIRPIPGEYRGFWEGPYGELRIDLLNHLIEVFEGFVE